MCSERMATLIFTISAAFVLYILLGYPLLLDFLARHGARPVKKRAIEPSVTVVLPVHNGARWIASKLESILALDYPRHLLDILVVSDGSDDDTAEIVRRYRDVRLLELPRGGKARAINAALEVATGEVLLFTDVRQLLDPPCLRRLMANLGDPEVGVVTGEIRWLATGSAEEADINAYLHFEHWIRDRLSQIDSLLGVAGALYAIRRELARPLPPDTQLDDVCMVLTPFFSGRRIVLEKSAVAFDVPNPLQGEFRRKVRTIAGLYQTLYAYPALLGPSNRMWLHFVSHKLGRVWLPFFLAAAAISSAWLPAPWNRLALAGQAGIYLLAAVDFVAPQSFPLKRLTSAARTFFVMMAAAVCGLFLSFVPPRTLWKPSA